MYDISEDKRKKIEVINRGRATGRTTELIRRCAKHGYALIVTPSKNRARFVFEQARSQGIYIPFPITFKEFCRGEFCERNVEAFFFDDLDDSLKEIARWTQIEAVVIEGDETNTAHRLVDGAVDSNTPNTLEALEALERILNYCEEIDLHLPEAEQSGYRMLPDYETVRKALAERKHGKWIDLHPQGDSRFMCSVCKWKENVPTCMGKPTVWEYCPSCGARMDGDGND